MNFELNTQDFQNILRIFAEYRPATFQDAEVAVAIKQKILLRLQNEQRAQIQAAVDKQVAEVQKTEGE